MRAPFGGTRAPTPRRRSMLACGGRPTRMLKKNSGPRVRGAFALVGCTLAGDALDKQTRETRGGGSGGGPGQQTSVVPSGNVFAPPRVEFLGAASTGTTLRTKLVERFG